jgi:Aerotolerance regulator N-terminal
MSFLQPILLVALPLISLPIIIHLINQRRFQTIRWGAMMFLLAANRMSRGYARLRQWLIMAFRMAAIAALVFAVSRPLAGGWLGLAGGGRADTTIILLDRSPSMQQEGALARTSKRETGVRQLVQALETLGSARWVLIDSTSSKPRELESVSDLLTSTGTGPADASADLPAMLLAARDYVKDNKTGQTEVWICSDLRDNDWNATSGRWQVLRDGFLELTQGVRFHLLAYPDLAPEDLAVRVTDVRRRKTSDAAELLVTLKVTRQESTQNESIAVPVGFEIDGARSEVTANLSGTETELRDHPIPLEKGRDRGWGKVSIPADANPADNDFWFVFEQPAPRRTVVVVDDPQAARTLRLAASISPDPSIKCAAEVIAAGQVPAVDWENVSLLLWQAPIPSDDVGRQIRAFVDRGGTAMFFPTRVPSTDELFGVRFTTWSEGKPEIPLDGWRGDQDLLAHSASGAPLPVGQLQVRKYCGLSGEVTPLATLRGGAPLLARVATDHGAVYYCATTPAPGDSSLATSGVVFYVMIQRALASGASALGSTRQLTAGEPPRDDPTLWKPVSGAQEGISTDYPFHRGVYQSAERLLAVNRGAVEAQAPVLGDAQVAGLFRGLDFDRVDDRAGNVSSLIQEIWRMFLIAMMGAMIAEAALCLPKLARPRGAGA